MAPRCTRKSLLILWNSYPDQRYVRMELRPSTVLCVSEILMSMNAWDEPQPGGCRSLFMGGCLLTFGLCLLAFAAVMTVVVVLVRLVILGLSYL